MPTFLTAGVAVQLQRDLGFGASALGIAIAISLATSTIGSVPLAGLVQDAGWSWGMRLAAIVSTIALGGVALFATNWALLTVMLAVGGLAKSLGHPASNLALAAEAPDGHQGLLFGIKQAGVPAAATLAGLSVPLLALNFGWRSAFWAAAVFTLVFGLLVPSRSRRPAPRPADTRSESGRRRDVHAPSLLLLAAAAGMGVAVSNSVALFLTSYGVEAGFSEGAAGFVLAVGSATGIVVRIAIGWLADRHRLGLGAVTVMLLSSSGGIALMTTGSHVLIVVGAMVAFGAGWGWAGLFNLAVVRRNPGVAAVATGFTQAGIYTGAAAGPLIFGLLAENIGYKTAWWVFAGISIAAAATMRVADRASLRISYVQVPD